MNEFAYIFNEIDCEVFPLSITQNKLIVYHGTCEYHSKSIEENGFVVNTAPYDILHAKKLIDILESEDFLIYDVPKGILKWTIAMSMKHYIEGIEKNEFKLSFSSLSTNCVSYTYGSNRGGQAMNDIREARQIIEESIKNNDSLKSKIPNEVNVLFDEISIIDKSKGVIYAIQLPEDLRGIEYYGEIIYSSISINKDCIVGKVIIPDEILDIEKHKAKSP